MIEPELKCYKGILLLTFCIAHKIDLEIYFLCCECIRLFGKDLMSFFGILIFSFAIETIRKHQCSKVPLRYYLILHLIDLRSNKMRD